jgi:hypothetical protein
MHIGVFGYLGNDELRRLVDLFGLKCCFMGLGAIGTAEGKSEQEKIWDTKFHKELIIVLLKKEN